MNSVERAAETTGATQAVAPAANASPMSYVRRLGPAGLLAAISAILPAAGGFTLLALANPIAEWLRAQDGVGIFCYSIAFALLAGLAFLPTYAQAILGGWTFGFRAAFPAALVGFTGGAMIGYVLSRWASGDRVVRLIEEQPKWKAVYEALLGGGFWKTLGIVTLLRIPPNSPFAVTNLVLSATRVPLAPYLIGTLVGMAPRTCLAVYIGSGLAKLDFENHERTWMFVGGLVITAGVLAVVGSIANKAIARVTGRG